MAMRVPRSSRNIIVCLYEIWGQECAIIANAAEQDGSRTRTQLIHQQMIQPPKNLTGERRRRWIGLPFVIKQPDKHSHRSPEVLAAVKQSYQFITSHYSRGDQIVLVAELWREHSAVSAALDLLVWCLTAGTRPTRAQRLRDAVWGKAKETIPLSGVVLRLGDSVQDIVTAGDGLLMRFPVEVKRVVCANYRTDTNTTQSSAATRGPAGQVESREICIYPNSIRVEDALLYASKQLIRYRPGSVQVWDQREPQWTHAYTTNPDLPSEEYPDLPPPPEFEGDMWKYRDHVRLVGMDRHYLELYRDMYFASTTSWGFECLVWRSFKDEDTMFYAI